MGSHRNMKDTVAERPETSSTLPETSGAAAYEADEALRAAVAGDEAEFDFGEAHFGGIAGDAQRAGHGELAAAA